jgi:hypothetical protein
MKKRKPSRFRASKAVKSAAREVIGSPKASRVIQEKTKREKEKHKATLEKLIEEQA